MSLLMLLAKLFLFVAHASSPHGHNSHISVYWIVANMVDGRLPSPSAPIWSTDPAQYILFRPLITALSKGTIAAFHTALDARRVFWSKRGLYDLMRTRLEMILARNLARRVFMVGSGVMGSSTFGYDEVGKVAAAASGNEMQEGGGGVGDAAMQDDVGATTIRAPPRISLDDMCVAWRLAGDESFTEVDDQENQSDLGKYFGWPTQAQVLTAPTAGIQAPSVTLIHQLLSITALITRLIDCGYLKGYINANNRCVVVSRKQPFPPPSSVARRVMERERWWAPQLMDRGIVERGGDDEDDD